VVKDWAGERREKYSIVRNQSGKTPEISGRENSFRRNPSVIMDL
jgi:hypothetical protein